MLLTHSIQFYLNDDYLLHSVSDFVRAGFKERASVIVISNQEHRELLRRSIEKFGQPENRLVLFDGAGLLSRFVVDEWPNEERFRQSVGRLVADAARAGSVHIYDEMVSLLSCQGQKRAAIHLEGLWNRLAQDHPFSLFCAYPILSLARETDPESFEHMVRTHTHVRAGKTLVPI